MHCWLGDYCTQKGKPFFVQSLKFHGVLKRLRRSRYGRNMDALTFFRKDQYHKRQHPWKEWKHHMISSKQVEHRYLPIWLWKTASLEKERQSGAPWLIRCTGKIIVSVQRKNFVIFLFTMISINFLKDSETCPLHTEKKDHIAPSRGEMPRTITFRYAVRYSHFYVEISEEIITCF